MTGKGLSAGTYRFRVAVGDDSYDFQYNIRKDANHREIMEGLCDFINKAKIGLTATPVSRSADKIMMRIESDMTGSPDGGNLFSFADRTGEGGDGRGIVSYYNMNNVVSRPSSASFEWNGETKETLGNTFVLGRSLEVSMYAPGDQAAQISYIPDSDKILDGVSGIIRSYNKLVDSTNNYSGQTGQSPRLIREYQNLLKPYLSELESCGITLDEQDEDGRVTCLAGSAGWRHGEADRKRFRVKPQTSQEERRDQAQSNGLYSEKDRILSGLRETAEGILLHHLTLQWDAV